MLKRLIAGMCLGALLLGGNGAVAQPLTKADKMAECEKTRKAGREYCLKEYKALLGLCQFGDVKGCKKRARQGYRECLPDADIVYEACKEWAEE